MKQTLESLPDAVLMIAPDGEIIAANSLMQDLIGFTPEELLAHKTEEFLPEETRAAHVEWRKQFFQSRDEDSGRTVDTNREIRALTKTGGEVRLDLRLKQYASDETGPCLIAAFRIIPTEKQSGRTAPGKTDVLKELPGKDEFLSNVRNAIAQAQAEGRFVSVLTIDSGLHRNIVDTLGREAADVYLREMVARISRIRRKQDTVARLSGDEFAVMIDSLGDPDLVNKLAERIQSFMSAPIFIGEHSFVPRPSIGVSVFPTDASDAESLLRSADLAMHDAKTTARGGIRFFNDEMGERASQRLTLESDLRSAIYKDEFVVHFQPIFDLQARKRAGVESFLRWQHAKLGTIELRDFMQIAEETGMAAPLGETALWLTFEAIRKWKAMGHWPMRIIHALSPVQLTRSQSLLRQLRGMLLDSKIDPKHIQFTIHETDMPLTDEQITALLEISEMGFGICVDEFGTGASFLTYLLDLPVNTIKLAPGLVSESLDNDHNKAVLSAVVQMAHSLDIEVIATDIESNGHSEFAIAIGVDAGQGDWQCPSMDFDKVTIALFPDSKKRNEAKLMARSHH